MTTQRESKRIDKVTVKWIQDDDGDLSWLGEYSDSPENLAIVATGQYEGEFVDDLPCECEHSRESHKEVEDGYAPCSECDCEDFDQVTIQRGREYRYFNPEVDSSVTDRDESRKYAMQDYKRMKDYGNDWYFIGIQAEARISIPDGGRTVNGQTRTIQRITSGGLWGIESDSEESHFAEVEREELDQLKTQLHALGFSKRAIVAAFRNVERDSE